MFRNKVNLLYICKTTVKWITNLLMAWKWQGVNLSVIPIKTTYKMFSFIYLYHTKASVRLTRFSDSAALRLPLVLTQSPGLGSFSLPVSSGFLWVLTLQQLLWTSSPDERPGPGWRRGRDQRLLTALSARTATTAGDTKKWVNKSVRLLV